MYKIPVLVFFYGFNYVKYTINSLIIHFLNIFESCFRTFIVKNPDEHIK
ncbi:hypothetical protein L1283_001764 [Sphingobacterium sp. HSC-15S19]